MGFPLVNISLLEHKSSLYPRVGLCLGVVEHLLDVLAEDPTELMIRLLLLVEQLPHTYRVSL